jgi:glucose-6-phosphate dehydrogenase assembly protein OpcA
MNDKSNIRNSKMEIGERQLPVVDVKAIERELTSLWKEAGEDDGGVIRACLLNLIVFTPSAEFSNEVDRIIDEVTAGHPCRAILIISNRDAAEPHLSARVASRCTMPTATSKQVCCEQVTLEAAGQQVNEVPSATIPLLLSDLSIYLWWRAVPRLGDRVFKRLVDGSDRVIIDSADFASPHQDLSTFATLLRESPRWTAFSDLNWARLTAWRALLAGFFDVVTYREALAQLDGVVIGCAPPAADPTAIPPRALMLAGWLASRLEWKVNPGGTSRRENATLFEFVAKERKIKVEITTTQNVEAGRLGFVTLSTAGNSPTTFTVKRSEDRRRIETDVILGDERKIQRVLSYENWSEAELIGRELEILGHDRVYEQAILIAGEMVSALSHP